MTASSRSLFCVLCLGCWALVIPASHAQVPSIIVPPASQSSAVGGTIQFTVSATGGGTLAYQWRKNGTNMVNGVSSGAATISGATATAVTLTTITANDQANYTCRITNSSGSITSSIASLTVFVAPNITTQPKSANTNVGSTASFTVVASGTAPFTYQWYKDGAPISGATLNAYSISGVFLSDSGTYNVRVSNAAGSSTSTNAVLNIGIAPAITSQPSSLIVTQGQSASFSVTATGTPLNYYWKKNGLFIPGQTNSSLAFASTVPTNAATYTCQVSNFLGNVTSAGAVLTVYYPPTITLQPVGKTVGVGSNFTVNVTASGVPAIAYQWRTNGTAITGATASSYTVTGAKINHAADYDVVITNSVGSVTSSVANISIVYYPPTINQQPIGGNIAVGNSFILSASATGTAPISWQWFKDGLTISNAATMTTNLTGLATFSYTNNSAQIADSGNYQVVLENSSGSATSSVAVVNVGYGPVIVLQPLSATNIVGGSNTFSCIVTGSAPINLQWTLNGNPIAEATNMTLSLTYLQPANIGYYALTATNAFGGTVSSNAALNLVGYDFGLSQGLVAYYPFNGNANDESGFGNNATNNGAVLTTDRFSIPGSAFFFGGNNSIGCGSLVSRIDQLTFSAWVKTTDLTATEHGIVVKPRSGDTYGGARLGLYNAGFDAGFQNNSVTLVAFDASQHADGNWHLAAMVNNFTNSALYVDGAFVSQITYPSNFSGALSSQPIIMGTEATRYFNGVIDDVRIYNRALSSIEVASLYAMEADVPVITQQPQPQTVNAGATATFSVTAIATNLLSYQWFKDGMALGSATNSSLTLSNLQPNKIGYYSVAVSNAVAGVTSTNAALTLNGYSFSQWQGLVAYYPFNGNANDASGNGNNGTVYGAALSSDRNGIAASAYSFDGINNHITINSSAILEPKKLMTISVWAYQKTNQSGNYTRLIAKFLNSPGSSYGSYQIITGEQGLDTIGRTGFTMISSTAYSWTGLNSQNILEKWVLLTACWDGNQIIFYQNGKPVSSTINTGEILYDGGELIFGNDKIYANACFNGLIDDIRIYNRALSSNEVASLYAMEADVPVITQQPQPQTVNAGGAVTFKVTATATNALNYQWRKNSSPIPGATNAIFALTNAQTADVGFYSVTVSNAVSGVVSASALLNLTGYADPTWQGLVAYYPFNGNANDESGNKNDGSITRAMPTSNRFRTSNSAYAFSGRNIPLDQRSWIDITNNILNIQQPAYAISMWVSISNIFQETGVFFNTIPLLNCIGAGYNAIPTRGKVSWAIGDGYNWLSIYQTGNKAGYNTNDWYHFTFIKSGNNYYQYVNGVLDFVQYALVPNSINVGLRIGGDAMGDENWEGNIDDIRIYNRALSADEVAYLYTLESQSTLQPPQTLSASAGAGRSLNLNLTGIPGRNYILQSTTNLQPPIPWLPVLTNAAATNGVWQFADTNLNSAQKFYRVTTP